MCVCICVSVDKNKQSVQPKNSKYNDLYFISRYIYYFLVVLTVCFCQHSN